MQQRIRFEMNYASDAVITRANIEEEAACSTLHFSCFENQLSGIAIKMSTNINLKFNKNARALITHFYLHTLEHLITNFPIYKLKSTWVIPFTYWAFKLILKALNCNLQLTKVRNCLIFDRIEMYVNCWPKWPFKTWWRQTIHFLKDCCIISKSWPSEQSTSYICPEAK